VVGLRIRGTSPDPFPNPGVPKPLVCMLAGVSLEYAGLRVRVLCYPRLTAHFLAFYERVVLDYDFTMNTRRGNSASIFGISTA
jgi:hypothetical protein